MATRSLRMRDDLKQKAQQSAKEQGVSLNGFINATLAQQETLTFFSERQKDVEQETLHRAGDTGMIIWITGCGRSTEGPAWPTEALHSWRKSDVRSRARLRRQVRPQQGVTARGNTTKSKPNKILTD